MRSLLVVLFTRYIGSLNISFILLMYMTKVYEKGSMCIQNNIRILIKRIRL